MITSREEYVEVISYSTWILHILSKTYHIYHVRGVDVSTQTHETSLVAPQVLRVFPNPERYKTCYVDDWDERIKKIDRDRATGNVGMDF